MKRSALLICTFALALATLAPAGDAAKDAAKIQGKWIATFESEGKKVTIELTFARNTFTISFAGMPGKGTFKLDPSKSPSEIDLAVTEFEKKEYIGKTALGIYAFDGDDLKWCSNEPGREGRPKAFPAKA